MTRRNKNVDRFIRQAQLRKRPRGSGVSTILANLWAIIIADLDITGQRWDNNMSIYVRNEIEKLAQNGNRVDRTSLRGNLAKSLLRPQMTWKVFVNGLRFLRWREFKVVIIGKHENGVVSEHSLIVNMRNITGIGDDELEQSLLPGGEQPRESENKIAESHNEPQYRNPSDAI